MVLLSSMMISLQQTLMPWCQETFPETIKDQSLNGLQIFSQDSIHKIGFAVSANARTLAAAHAQGVDTLIVHHGLFWGQSYGPLTGLLGQRVRQCFDYKINLIAYHIPLDGHPIFGNNVQLGQRMHWNSQRKDHHGLVYQADVPCSSLQALTQKLTQTLGREAIITHAHLADSARIQPYRIGWCSGSGGDYMIDPEPFDIFISGEFTERHYDLALETQTILITCGHYATERFGVLALQEHLQDLYLEKIETIFLEEWSPW